MTELWGPAADAELAYHRSLLMDLRGGAFGHSVRDAWLRWRMRLTTRQVRVGSRP